MVCKYLGHVHLPNEQISTVGGQCVNASGITVAWYVLKIPGEQYANSSGCMFGVEEPYPHLAVGKSLLMR